MSFPKNPQKSSENEPPNSKKLAGSKTHNLINKEGGGQVKGGKGGVLTERKRKNNYLFQLNAGLIEVSSLQPQGITSKLGKNYQTRHKKWK